MQDLTSFILAILAIFLLYSGFIAQAEEGEILPQAARVGAGIGIGKINIGRKLSPGGIYPLPKIPVINTGTASEAYEMGLSFFGGQKQLRPKTSWISFSPRRFYLLPDESRRISATLRLPTNARPGDYFTLLEIRRVMSKNGQVKVGPAAAAKLYFSVKPTSILGAFRARVLTFIETNPIIYLVLAAICLIEAGLLLRRHFRFSVELKRR